MTQIVKVSIARTADGKDLPLPSYESRYHMGLVLRAAVPVSVRLESGDRVFVPVGFAIGIPEGYCGFVVSSPVLAQKNGVVVLDAPKLISPADRGPLFVLVQNMSLHQTILHRGEIVGQLVVQPVAQVSWHDFSNVAPDSKKQTEVVVEHEGIQFQLQETDKMTSPKRQYHDARHRFQETEADE